MMEKGIPYEGKFYKKEVEYDWKTGYKKQSSYSRRGVLHGPCKTYFKTNGRVRSVTTYNKGKVIKLTRYYATGIIRSTKKMYEHNHFEYASYYKSGKTKSCGRYIGSTPIGYWKYFHEDGKIKSEGRYNRMGIKNGIWRYNGGLTILEYNKGTAIKESKSQDISSYNVIDQFNIELI